MKAIKNPFTGEIEYNGLTVQAEYHGPNYWGYMPGPMSHCTQKGVSSWHMWSGANGGKYVFVADLPLAVKVETPIKNTMGNDLSKITYKSDMTKKPKTMGDDEKHPMVNHHVITVACNGASATFDFWQSFSECTIHNRDQLLQALGTIVSDAQSGIELDLLSDIDAAQYVSDEFGFDSIKEAHRVAKGLQENFRKFRSVYSGDLSELWEQLEEDNLI